MSNILDDCIDTLGVSRPVFRITKDSYGYGRLEVTPLYPYSPEPSDDEVQQLVNNNHQEMFDGENGCFVLAKSHIKEAAMGTIISNMLNIIERNLEIKKPRHSKLYKFYNYLNKDNTYLYEALIHLWKYSRSYVDSNGHFKAEHVEHMKNTLGILELLRKKYE